MGSAHQTLVRSFSGRVQKTLQPAVDAFGLEAAGALFPRAPRREEIRRALLELVKVELKSVVEDLKRLPRRTRRRRGHLKKSNGRVLPS